MEEVASQALARLRENERGERDALSRLIARTIMDTPLTELLDATVLANILHEHILREANTPESLQHLVTHWMTLANASLNADVPLNQQLPKEVVSAIQGLAQTPMRLDPDFLETILDKPAVRDLLSVVLEDALRRFTQRAKKLEEGVLGGFGGRVARRGRGLRKSILNTKAGGIAENLVHSVADEVEQAFERRIKEFLGGASQRAVRTIVHEMSRKDTEATRVDLQVDIVNSVLDMSPTQLRDAVMQEDTQQALTQMQHHVLRWVEHPETVQQLDTFLRTTFDRLGTVGNLYPSPMSSAAASQTLMHAIDGGIKKTVESADFEVWWHSLFK